MQTVYHFGADARVRRRKKLGIAIKFGVALIAVLAVCKFFIFDKPNTAEFFFDETAIVWQEQGYAAVGTVANGVLASSDDGVPRPIASMAKVILALAITEMEPIGLNESGKTYVFTQADIDNFYEQVEKNNSVLPVSFGAEITEYQALQRILIASDGCVSDKMAREIFGSVSEYTAYANDMLRRMGITKTIVADSSGLSPETVGTPSDMVLVGIAAMKHPVIAQIVAQKTAELPDAPDGVVVNTNELLAVDGIVGIKTGTTDEAGYCLLFSAHYANEVNGEVTIVGVVMGLPDEESRFYESAKLLESAKVALGFVVEP
jgi:D-alanyl-D-alanine carboxypeptidase (penicillin-binding protein 5/6)